MTGWGGGARQRRLMSAAAALVLVPLFAGPVSAQSSAGESQAAVSVSRFGGADRYATSLAVAEELASAAGGSLPRVVIVSGESWQDAVVAAPLTSLNRSQPLAPILLSHPSSGLTAAAVKFIERVGAGRAAIVSTDTAEGKAVPTSVDAALRALGLRVERFGGADAYATSADVADAVADALGGTLASLNGDGGGGTVFVASGAAFADALVAGPLAGGRHGAFPLLLTPKSGLDAAVRGWLMRRKPTQAVILGGTAAVSDAVEAQIAASGVRTVVRIAGSDRFDTAAKLAAWAAQRYPEGCYGGVEAGLARSDVPFDSFSAGPLLAQRCAPLLLTTPTGVPAATATALESIRRPSASQSQASPSGARVNVFGGEAAVSAAAVSAWVARESSSSGGSASSSSGDDAAAAVRAAEQLMASLVNTLRGGLGLPALTVSTELSEVARDWSEEMLATGDFEHNPRYSRQYPGGWISAAENIAYSSGRTSLAAAVRVMHEGLVGSPGHYANMVDAGSTHLGIGIARSGSTVYATQNFATYRSGVGSSRQPSPSETSTPLALTAPPPLSSAATAAVGTPADGSQPALPWWDTSPIKAKNGSETVTVFLCDTDGTASAQLVGSATRELNQRISPYFTWASSGRFRFDFEAGRVLTPTASSTCVETVEDQELSDSYIVIAIGIADQAQHGFGWTGARGGKAAIVVGGTGPTGLEPLLHKKYGFRDARVGDFHLVTVIDALFHTHLGIGFNDSRFHGSDPDPDAISNRLGCGAGILAVLENRHEGTSSNPAGYSYFLSCWEMKALGWPRAAGSRVQGNRDANCRLLPPQNPLVDSFVIGEESAKLTWQPPPRFPWSHAHTGYQIELREWEFSAVRRSKSTAVDSEFESVVARRGKSTVVYSTAVDTSVRQIEFTDLSPGKDYSVDLEATYAPQADPFHEWSGGCGWCQKYVRGREWHSIGYPYFSPRAKSSILRIEKVEPNGPRPEEIVPSLMEFRIRWDPHPHATSYTVGGLGDPEFVGVERGPSGDLHSHGGWGTDSAELWFSSSLALTTGLAFGTEYEVFVMACIPPVPSRPDDWPCVTHEYVRTKFTTPTRKEFSDLYRGPSDSDSAGEQGIWHSAADNRPKNVQIDTSVKRLPSGDWHPVITLSWDPVPGAWSYIFKNPWHDPSLSHGSLPNQGDPEWSPFDHDRSLPALSSRTNRISTYLHAEFGDTVSFEGLRTCGPREGTTFDEFGWPERLSCSDAVDIDLVIPAP